MASNAAQWTVLGYDTRKLGQLWLGAWNDVLFGNDSPLLKWFDPCVSVTSGAGESRVYQAGYPVDAENVHFRAIELPESVYLSRIIELPAGAEANLAAVMHLEVNAYSPFPSSETRFGWTILSRSEQSLRVGLLIASQITLLKKLDEQADGVPCELWGFIENRPVLFEGFGEGQRRRQYLLNLGKAAALVLACFVMVLTICALLAVTSSSILQTKSMQMDEINQNARPAMLLRDRLSTLDAVKERVNLMVSAHPPANTQLARLTTLIDNDAYLTDFVMEGRAITIRGRAADATRVQQQLTAETAFSGVSAPQSIRKLGDSEVFAFDLVLAAETDR